MARGLFEQHGIGAASLAAVVVADGPGSFTGLRIGIAFAKGLARALGIPLLSAPSMMAAARSVATSGAVVVDYNALRGDAYRAVYQLSSGGVVTLSPPAIVTAGEAATVTGRHFMAGDAHASAAALLSLVGVPGGATAVEDPAGWEPAYGRPAEAEARRLAAPRGPA